MKHLCGGNPPVNAHNYPLLLLAEQGTIGLAIFLFLTAVIFIYGENIYHRVKNEDDKKIALTLLLVLAMVYVNLLLSDLLESDKVGPFYFICIALLTNRIQILMTILRYSLCVLSNFRLRISMVASNAMQIK